MSSILADPVTVVGLILVAFLAGLVIGARVMESIG